MSVGSWDVRGAVDGNGNTAWAIVPEFNKDHTAVFEMAEEVGDGQASRLTVRLSHRLDQDQSSHLLGRFRLSITNDAENVAMPREFGWI